LYYVFNQSLIEREAGFNAPEASLHRQNILLLLQPLKWVENYISDTII